MADSDTLRLREKYRHFRILVIGRANAGKTTLLKRVCNTKEEPCIYDENKKNLLEPTQDRGIHDVNRAFSFTSNPEFIFHDSPGFENGGEDELKRVQSFIAERAKATEVDDQLHAIWFCFILNKARPLLDLEKTFFNEARSGNVPVVAIFTKFDNLITEVYDDDLDDDAIRQVAEDELLNRFEQPLRSYTHPPRAYVRMEDLQKDDGNHQDQVKELMEKTADSLDELALKMLFVSVQQNNLELCLKYAIKYLDLDSSNVVQDCLSWFRHAYIQGHGYEKTEEDVRGRGLEVLGGEELIENSRIVAQILEAKFDVGSGNRVPLTAVVALLLCAENSFWYLRHCDSFVDAFEHAVANYLGLGSNVRGEDAVKALEYRKVTKLEKEELTKIIFKHRLPRPN